MSRQSVSAFIICCNEERNIGRCLESITWCDEIIVIDSGSTDKTLEIAGTFTDKVIVRSWPGFVAQKRFGLEQCKSDWVLNLDADEEVSPELKDEIQRVLNSPEEGIGGYELLRVVFYLGKWWRKGGWYPEYRLRFLKRDQASWGGEDPHEHANTSGQVKRLKCELRHYTYTQLADQVKSLNNFSSVAAQSLHKRGVKSSLLSIILRPISRFIKFYFIKLGFLEGFPGFIVACLEGYYAFLKYVKLWELNHSKS